MRPSVTSATFRPRSCSTARIGVRLCSSGMPLAFGPWKRTTTTVSAVSSPAWNAALTSSWSWKTRAGASMTWRSGATAETFITPVPRLPASRWVPPVGWNGSAAGRRILSLREAVAPSAQASDAVDHLRLLGVAGEAVAGDGAGVGVQEAGVEQLADHVAEAPGGVEVVHVGQAVGVDARHQRAWRRRARRSPPSRAVMPAARAMAIRWIRRLVEPPVAFRPTMPLTKARSSSTSADGGVFVAEGGDGEGALGALDGQRLAQGRAGVDEAGARQVQAHELHQHLVGVGGAVEGAGAGAVVGGHLGLHQLVAADLAGGELLADLGLGVVGDAGGHRAGGQEDRGQVAEGGGGDDEAGHDLVADAEVDGAVEDVVRERDAGGHGDHVAGEEAELHAGLALGDAVAHRRARRPPPGRCRRPRARRGGSARG